MRINNPEQRSFDFDSFESTNESGNGVETKEGLEEASKLEAEKVVGVIREPVTADNLRRAIDECNRHQISKKEGSLCAVRNPKSPSGYTFAYWVKPDANVMSSLKIDLPLVMEELPRYNQVFCSKILKGDIKPSLTPSIETNFISGSGSMALERDIPKQEDLDDEDDEDIYRGPSDRYVPGKGYV